MARRFSERQKRAVEIVTGRSGDADHIEPFSLGGPTEVENCQLLSKEANSRKGAFMFTPRRWQSEFIRKWDERPAGHSFMLIAIPGGGKTMAALEVCRRWMAAGSDRRMIVVVPTDNLREQWRDEAARFGIELQTKEFGTNFKHGFQGGATTYHSVANNSLVYRSLCSVAPTIVVFDEIHHCGNDAHFGRGIRDAFTLAKERLLMSGTPWKTDGTPIPFVRYDGSGYALGDFCYDYPRALNEDVVRYLVFDHSRGEIRNDSTGITELVGQEITDEEASRRLRRLLDPLGLYVQEQIRLANTKLREVRQTIPDAAAMAACIDQSHAEKVASVIKSVTGDEPSVIVSDSDISNDTVKEFRSSSSPWLVCVRKVSEGTDIKRLQVLCYLTNTTSELFFRQLIGRVSRVRGIDDYEAYVFLPADPRLIRCAENIENAQVQALKEQAEIELRELEDRSEDDRVLDPYSTSHVGTDVVFVGSDRLEVAEAKRIEEIARATGVPMAKVRQIMQMATRGEQAQSETEVKPKESRIDDLRSKCNKRAYRLAKILGCDVREIHSGFRRQADMTEAELEDKLRSLSRRTSEAMKK